MNYILGVTYFFTSLQKKRRRNCCLLQKALDSYFFRIVRLRYPQSRLMDEVAVFSWMKTSREEEVPAWVSRQISWNPPCRRFGAFQAVFFFCCSASVFAIFSEVAGGPCRSSSLWVIAEQVLSWFLSFYALSQSCFGVVMVCCGRCCILRWSRAYFRNLRLPKP